MADTPLSLRYQSLSEALDKLARTVWALRLGGTHDDRRLKLLDEVAADLGPLLDRMRRVRLDVGAYSLTFHGDLVYREANRSRSLAFRLFREGVETLALLPGLEAEELATVATVLSLPPDVTEQVGDDLVTRLWRHPLQHVQITVRPWHAMRALDPVNPAPTLIEAYASDALVFFEEYAAGTTAASTPVAAEAVVMRHFADLIARASDGHLRAGDTANLPATSSPQIETSKALDDVFALLVTAFPAEELVVPLPTLEELLVTVIRSIMSQGDAEAVQRVYSLLEALGEDPRVQSLGRGALLEDVRARAASAETLNQLLPAQLGIGEAVALHWLPGFFASHCRDRLEHFEPLFSLNLTTRALQALTHTVLDTFSPPHGFWVKLMTDVSAEVASVIIEAIDDTWDERSRTLLFLALASHRNAKIRRRAFLGFPLLGPRVQSVLEEALRDRDASVRVAAIGKLAETAVPAVGIFLVDALRRSDPDPNDHAERRAILVALPKLGGDRYLHLLLDQLDHFEGRLERMSNPEHTDEFGTCVTIIDAIATIGSRRAAQALELRAADSPHTLAAAYIKATQDAREAYEAVPSQPRRPAPVSVDRGDALLDEPPSDPSLPDITDLLYSYVHEAASATSESDGSLDALEQALASRRPDEPPTDGGPVTPSELPQVNIVLDGGTGGSGTRPTRPVTNVTAAPPPGRLSTRPTRSTRPSLPKVAPPEPEPDNPWLDNLDDPHLNSEVSGMIEELMNGELTLDGDSPSEELP